MHYLTALTLETVQHLPRKPAADARGPGRVTAKRRLRRLSALLGPARPSLSASAAPLPKMTTLTTTMTSLEAGQRRFHLAMGQGEEVF